MLCSICSIHCYIFQQHHYWNRLCRLSFKLALSFQLKSEASKTRAWKSPPPSTHTHKHTHSTCNVPHKENRTMTMFHSCKPNYFCRVCCYLMKPDKLPTDAHDSFLNSCTDFKAAGPSIISSFMGLPASQASPANLFRVLLWELINADCLSLLSTIIVEGDRVKVRPSCPTRHI